MEKQQEIPFDWGVEGTPGYYTVTFSTTKANEPRVEQASYALDQFQFGQAAIDYTPVQTPYSGSQVFSSSDFQIPMFNTCTNFKRKGYNHPFCSVLVLDTYTPPRYYVAPYRRYFPKSHYSDMVYATTMNTAGDWMLAENARMRAWRSMIPKFEGRVNLLNSLFELKDFADIAKVGLKGITKNPLNYVNDFKHLTQIINNAERKLGMVEGSTTLGMLPSVLTKAYATVRGISSGILTKNLAIDPTIMDIMSISQQLKATVKDAQDTFADKTKDLQRSHYSEYLMKNLDMRKPYTGLNAHMEDIRSESLKFTATMEYRFSYTRRKAADALKRFWGLNLNAETVWNAIRWTWIADYFIGLGDLIHLMGKDPNVKLLEEQYCESVLHEKFCGREFVRSPHVVSLVVNGQLVDVSRGNRVRLYGYETTSYQRRLVEPHRGLALPQLRTPNGKQLATLFALLVLML